MPSSQNFPLILRPQPSPSYRLVQWLLVAPIFRLLFRGRCRGMERVPRQGALGGGGKPWFPPGSTPIGPHPAAAGKFYG